MVRDRPDEQIPKLDRSGFDPYRVYRDLGREGWLTGKQRKAQDRYVQPDFPKSDRLLPLSAKDKANSDDTVPISFVLARTAFAESETPKKRDVALDAKG